MATTKITGLTGVHLNKLWPDTNFGGANTVFECGWIQDKMEKRALMRRDFSWFIRPGSTINTATFYFYVTEVNYHESSQFHGQRIRTENRDWVRDQATWNIYKTGNNWGTAGCYDIDTDRDTSVNSDDWVNPNGTGWWTLDITTLMQDAVDNRNRVIDFLIYNSFLPTEDEQADWQASYTSAPPYIYVDYTPPATGPCRFVTAAQVV